MAEEWKINSTGEAEKDNKAVFRFKA